LPFSILPVPVVLLPLPLFLPLFCLPLFASQFGSGRDKNLPPPTVEQRRDAEVSRLENAAGGTVRAAFSTRAAAAVAPCKIAEASSRTVGLVRRPLASEVLRVKRAESGSDRRANPHDAFFHVRPKKGNPKITPEKQLRPAHRGWASRTLDAIVLHLLHCRCCIIHHATSARRMAVLIHLPLQTLEFVRLDVNFLAHRSSREIGFSPIRESTSSPIVRFIERKVLFKP
jgi:hypothetical protein